MSLLLGVVCVQSQKKQKLSGQQDFCRKNFPDSKIFHAKTFQTKRVNRDTFAFATKVRKTREFHVFLANVHNVKLDGG